MLHWLLQTAADHPALARGIPPRDVLNADELARFAALPTEKRRRDWLLGRWTAKRLVQQVAGEQEPARPRLADIEIIRRPSGAPGVAGYPLALSISHSAGAAFCAVWPASWGPLGADLERVESRAASFAADYFSAAELEGLALVAGENTTPLLRDTMITATWSAKEAALKALQLGLTVDTRSVTCLLAQSTALPVTTWRPFAIEIDRQRLGRQTARLGGWWRTYDGFVLTLAGARDAANREKPDDENRY